MVYVRLTIGMQHVIRTAMANGVAVFLDLCGEIGLDSL
jgi:hypothetical protein